MLLTGIIKMYSTIAQIELFHLMFLRQFNIQIDTNLYAIKGGCNLRFFFNSNRYSEDLDIDVCIIQQQTLINKVNKILTSLSLLKLLQGYGISRIETSSPKQTQTTQRWKIQIISENSVLPYHTKIEFSRRSEFINASIDNIGMKLCQIYRLPPMRLCHYDLQDAMAQKLLALANRSITQARDIFDIYHLLHISKPSLTISLKKNTLKKAQEALLSINFEDYKSQVVTFLAEEQQKIFDNKDYWNVIINEVFHYINGLEQ